VIASEFAMSADVRERFKSEAQPAASIDHPNVVPAYEAGEADGVPYLAMRYVEGTDLRKLVECENGLWPERDVRFVWQLASALDAAHRRGLVHRDVKPPDVPVAEEGGGHAFSTDFGLTKHAAAAGAITRTGRFVRTPEFAAPERIRGETADARADVYALACVLFHALTGRVPFPRTSEPAKMHAHLSEEPPSVAALVPDIPAALDGVIATGMAKDPADRYASAGDQASRVDRAQAQTVGDPIGVGDAPTRIFVGSKVWVANTLDGTVSRIDPRASQVVVTIAAGRQAKDITAAHGFVWVVNGGSNTVSRIDPATNRLVGANLPVGRTPVGITASRNAVWVTNFVDDTVARIHPDPES
jgi:YVTN family beta-propeller protein